MKLEVTSHVICVTLTTQIAHVFRPSNRRAYTRTHKQTNYTWGCENLWRAEHRAGCRRAMGAAEGAPRWKAEADAAMETARMIVVLHMIAGKSEVQCQEFEVCLFRFVLLL